MNHLSNFCDCIGCHVWDCEVLQTLYDVYSLGDEEIEQLSADETDLLMSDYCEDITPDTAETPALAAALLADGASLVPITSLDDGTPSTGVTGTSTGVPGVKSAAASAAVFQSAGTFGSWRQCDHTLDAIKLANDLTIYASSYYTKSDRDWETDVSVYLDTSWAQWCDNLAIMLYWPDFGIPETTMEKVLKVARHVFDLAQSGQTVEVACLGSHGRTGTFLAILDLLAQESLGRNPSAKKAIRHIRKVHCTKALENNKQEWYVKAMACILNDKPVPPMPKLKSYKGTTTYKSTTTTSAGKGGGTYSNVSKTSTGSVASFEAMGVTFHKQEDGTYLSASGHSYKEVQATKVNDVLSPGWVTYYNVPITDDDKEASDAYNGTTTYSDGSPKPVFAADWNSFDWQGIRFNVDAKGVYRNDEGKTLSEVKEALSLFF